MTLHKEKGTMKAIMGRVISHWTNFNWKVLNIMGILDGIDNLLTNSCGISNYPLIRH
uniref:Uncharacterized protein n=1 Tax=Triticum urartu TaxID=4572 RepID=A0A8R7UJ76_TRIUA